MIDLDDLAAVAAADPSGMLVAAGRLGADLRAGLESGTAAGASGPEPDAVLVCGMGGSAVAGDVAAAMGRERFPIPVSVSRGSSLPAWVGPRTLVVASSYSGGTAETVAAFEAAAARGSRLAVVSSGGALSARAGSMGLPLARVPGGMQPRAALGHLAGALLGLLSSSGAFPDVSDEVDEAADVATRVAAEVAPPVATDANRAKRLAVAIGERVPVVWGSDGPAGVAAYRWRTQWNENAKTPATSSSMSELDHNEIVGWADRRGAGFAIVALRTDGERSDLPARFTFTADVARASGAIVEEVRATGAGPLAQMLSLIVVGDHASTYSAIMRGIDPTPVDAITRLKEHLG